MRALSVLAGALLLGICLAGLRIDVLNNWAYGLTVSHELAGVLVLAAIGVAALPAVAGLRGWQPLYAVGTVGCVVLTVMAALLNYTGEQGNLSAARQTAADTYEGARRDEASARQDEAAARAEAAAITEQASVEALALLVDAAKGRADREKGRGGCLAKCEAAVNEYAALVARLGQAKAKASALDRAEAARRRIGEAKAGAGGSTARFPMSSEWIAARTGSDVAEVQQSVDMGFALVAILVTQIFALLGHPAVKLIAWGIARPASKLSDEKYGAETGQAGQAGQVPQLSPKRKAAPRKLRAKRKAPAATVEQVQTWAAEALMPRVGAAVPAGDVHAAFVDATGATLSQAAFGAAMVEAGFDKSKRGGRVLYTGVSFRQALRIASAQ